MVVQQKRIHLHGRKAIYDARVSRPQEVKREQHDMVLRKKMDTSKEEYIVAMYFFEQYHSNRCWDTVTKARD